jgi:hypothetical protein
MAIQLQVKNANAGKWKVWTSHEGFAHNEASLGYMSAIESCRREAPGMLNTWKHVRVYDSYHKRVLVQFYKK